MADPRDALIAELPRVNEQLGALVAQQQSVMAAQRQLIADLERRLSEQDAAYATRATKLESEVRRLERELLGPKSEKIKIPPAERDLGEPEPNEEELIRRREEVAKKRRQRALQKQAMLTRDISRPTGSSGASSGGPEPSLGERHQCAADKHCRR